MEDGTSSSRSCLTYAMNTSIEDRQGLLSLFDLALVFMNRIRKGSPIGLIDIWGGNLRSM